MKHVSLFKKLGLGLSTVAAVSPVVVMSTSCSTKMSIPADFITYANFASDLTLERMESVNLSKEQIVLGSKRFCNGNYFLVVGSNTFEECVKYFTNTTHIVDREKWYDYSQGYLTSSIWYKTVFNLATDLQSEQKKINTDFGFVNYIDFSDFRIYANDGHILHVTQDPEKYLEETTFSPFAKWTDKYITATKTFNKTKYDYDWDETSVSTSDYIRQDDSAKAFRALCEYGHKMFPTNDKRKATFDISDNNKKTQIYLYKAGKLIEVFDAPTTYTEKTGNKITELVKANFTEDIK